MDVLVGLEGVDSLIGEFDTVTPSDIFFSFIYWWVMGDIREALDDGILMLDGSTLGFGTLFGSMDAFSVDHSAFSG
jgi:hypothetical protein